MCSEPSPLEQPPFAQRQPVSGVHLSGLLDDLDHLIQAAGHNNLSLEVLEDNMRGRGTALLMLVLSAPFILPIPIPFLAIACGLPMTLMGVSLAIRRQAHLPRFAYKTEISAALLRRVAAGLRWLLWPIIRLSRPRFDFMFWPFSWHLMGVSIAMSALVMSFPLPVPFANLIPAIGLILMASGILQRDGLAILLGHGFTVATVAYLFIIWGTVLELTRRWLN